jgi:hypothetical protein
MGLVMIASSLTSATSGINAEVPPLVKTETVESLSREVLPKKEDEKIATDKNAMVEKYVKNYFSDIPIMVEIAKCESRFRQYEKDGRVLRGVQNNLDFGVMQINEYYHGEDSAKLGLDIETLEGNTTYARFLYEKYGVSPWSSSSKCWAKSVAYSEYKELALK